MSQPVANKILIVDDEPFNLDLLEQELVDEGYVIERASDGVEALEKLDAFGPDVILLDYMMPRMTGMEVLKRLRQDEQNTTIPVIILTAKTTQEEKVRDFKAQYLGELPEQQQGNLAIFNGAQLQLQNLENSLDRSQQQRVYIESLISDAHCTAT